MFKAGQMIWAILLDSASLLTSIEQGQVTDPISAAHIDWLQSNPIVSNNDVLNPWSLSEDKSTLLFKGLIYIPDHSDIWLDVLWSIHNHQLAGHPGITKTIKNICRRYFGRKWLNLKLTILDLSHHVDTWNWSTINPSDLFDFYLLPNDHGV